MSEVTMTTDHPIAQCVDLRATFADQFCFTWDPAYAIERSDLRTIEAPWLTRIPCRFGFIYPYGGRRLAAYSAKRRRRLAALTNVRRVQGGAGCSEVIVTFDVGAVETVAALLHARRPPRVSDEERQRRRDRMLALRASRKTDDISVLEITTKDRPKD